MSSPASAYEQLLAGREVVVVCGPGGVGKTTVAAASGLLAAGHLGGRVLVLTVDPARRLATALGLDGLDNTEVRVDLVALGVASPRGELWAAQLDTKGSWDDLVRRHAPDERVREAILANAIYRDISTTFVQSHDYIAMERLHELHASGRYDLIVVDTPPSRNAIDFLEAPGRMAEFFGSRLLRWLTAPYRSRLFNVASRPFYTVADRILGQQFLREIADFFILFQTMHSGFVERAEEVETTLRSRRTAFVVVSTLDPAAVVEGAFLVDELAARHLHLGSVVVNRVLPSFLADREAGDAAQRLVDDAAAIALSLEAIADVSLLEQVLREIGGSFLDYGVVATRQGELRRELVSGRPFAVVPWLATEQSDTEGLVRVADALRGEATP